MCNEYARRLPLDRLQALAAEAGLPPLRWRDGWTPNALEGVSSVRIGDSAPVVGLQDGELAAQFRTWSWKTAGGRPVFNFVSEGRDFTRSQRALVFADGFYEFTTARTSRSKLKDKHLFERVDTPWFWIAAVVHDEAFALLTTAPGPGLKAYHDRQIVLLRPAEGLDWLTLRTPAPELFRPVAGTLKVTTLRRDGVSLGSVCLAQG